MGFVHKGMMTKAWKHLLNHSEGHLGHSQMGPGLGLGKCSAPFSAWVGKMGVLLQRL